MINHFIQVPGFCESWVIIDDFACISLDTGTGHLGRADKRDGDEH